MKKSEKQYDDGDIVFQEGDPSRSAYLLVSGNVELTMTGDKGPVTLAHLVAGEMFGEMGILDESPRSATARAVGPTTVRVIPRQQFLKSLKTDPATALQVMRKLVDRLRSTNERLVHGTTIGAAPRGEGAPPARVKAGLLERFLGVGRQRKARRPRSQRIEVRVAVLGGDENRSNTRHVVAALERRRGLKVRPLNKVLETDPAAEPVPQLPVVAATARQWLEHERADLLIWGDVGESGTTMHLRFVSATLEDEERPGCFGLVIPLDLPVAFDSRLADILHATCLAATTPGSDGKSQGLREALPIALEAALPLLVELPQDLTTRERATIQASMGNAASVLARQMGAAELYQTAAQSYQAALQSLDAEETRFERAMIQRNLGAVLQAMAERNNDADTLSLSADCYRDALGVLSRTLFPRYWAAIQNRLGTVLYKLDLKSSDTELVKRALAAYQAALQVYTRVDAPMRWAEVMNNFAQVAQILGRQLRNTEVLEKAAEACRGALEVRTKEKTPLLWAATQNNLGSALFMLGKLTREAAHLDGAAGAFRQAHELYADYGAARMISITEKNLSHVERLLGQLQPRGLPKMTSEEETLEGPLPDADQTPLPEDE